MKIETLRGKKILIVGMGIEGKASMQFLRSHVSDAVISGTDLSDGPEYLSNQHEFDLAVKSPGIKPEALEIPYTTATNLFFANTRGTVIGVTGTKGKSTTASLIYQMLVKSGKNAHLVGNIGNPMLLELLKEKERDTLYVCELSSYQLEDIQYSPHIAVFVSFFPEHMDHHGSVDKYWRAKKRITEFQTANDYFVYNPAFPQLAELSRTIASKAVPYTQDIPFEPKDIPLLGKHNRDNIRGALTVGSILGLDPAASRDAVSSFQPLPHRLQLVGTYGDIRFYDDAISTTPESTICAIEALEDVETIFLGGQDRGYEFSGLVQIIDRSRIRNIVFFPDSGSRIQEALLGLSKNKYIHMTTRDMKAAVQFAFDRTGRGKICLLSTASPSYSVWKNFEEKGQLFQKYVALIGKESR